MINAPISSRLVNDRFAAGREHLQVEAILAVEGIADRAERMVRRRVKEIAATVPDGNLVDRFSGVIRTLIVDLAREFAQLVPWTYDRTVRLYASTIPRAWWRAEFPTLVFSEDQNPGDNGIPPIVPRNDLEPVTAKQNMSPAEWQAKLKEFVFPPPTEQQTRDILLRPINGRAWPERVQQLSRLVTDAGGLGDQITRAYAAGATLDDLEKIARPFADNVTASARRIVRTEGLRIANETGRSQYTKLGKMLQGVQIVATLDENTRPSHAARNGTIYWSIPGKTPTLAELPSLPDAPNCVLPGAMIQGRFCAGSKAWYSGQAIEFTTAGGKRLAVTPNHPVLTDAGFFPAKQIARGDKLVCNRVGKPDAIVVADDEDHPPAIIEEVFRSLSEGQSVLSSESSPMAFHGDARFFNGKIDRVSTACLLGDDGHAFGHEAFHYGSLAGAVVQDVSLAGCGAESLGRFVVESSAPGCPGGTHLTIDETIRSDLPPLRFLGFGPAAVLGTVFNQKTNESERAALVSADSASRDSALVREALEGLASVVSTDDVIDVRTFDYDGHVYDLQSDCEMYVANGVIVHNCRCFDQPVLTPPPGAKDPRFQATFANAQGKTVPDPAAYSQWFSNADTGRQKMAVGVNRFNAVAKQSGGQAPTWFDFIDKDGQLVPINRLRSETTGQRRDRTAEVERIARDRETLFKQVAATGFIPDIQQPLPPRPPLPKATTPIQPLPQPPAPKTVPTPPPIKSGGKYPTFSGTSESDLRKKVIAAIDAGQTDSIRGVRSIGTTIREEVEKREDIIALRAAYQPHREAFDKAKEITDGKPITPEVWKQLADLKVNDAERRRTRDAYYDALSKAYRSALSSVRDFGGTVQWNAHDRDKNNPDAAKQQKLLSDALAALPADWIADINTKYQNGISVGRAKMISRRGDDRSFYRLFQGYLGLREGASEAIAAHELTHLAEEVRQSLNTFALAWRNNRIKPGEQPKPLPNDPASRCFEDDFTDKYIGRVYGADGRKDTSRSSEVLSMGIEGVFYGKHDILWSDPEMTDFILGMFAVR